MMDTPGIVRPIVDARTGAQTTKAVSRTSTYGRDAFVGASLDIPAASTKSLMLMFPFPVDLMEGFLLNEQAAKAALGDDVASFKIAPRTDVGAVFGAALAADVKPGDKQVAFVPAVLLAMVNVALLDVGFFRVEVEEGVNKEAAVLLVTDYDDDDIAINTGVVTLDIFKAWDKAAAVPVWNGFVNGYTVAAKVYLTRLAIHTMSMVGDGAVKFGSYGLDTAPITANIPMELEYQNVAAATARTVRIVLHVQTGKPLPL